MKRYMIEPNASTPNSVYIYEEGEMYKRCKLFVYNDTDLAMRIVNILNKQQEETTENND